MSTRWLRRFGAGFLASLLATGHAGAVTSDYPSHVVRVVVPFAAGGPTDAIARYLCIELGKSLAQTFIIDNKAGAQGLIGTLAVKEAKPDGYTLLFNEIGATFAIQPAIAKKKPFDSLKDFTPISSVAYGPIFLSVRSELPARNLKELVALSKSAPNGLTFGSAGGMGQMPTHIAPEMLKLRYGLKAQVVIYRGATPAMTDVAAGTTDFMTTTGMVSALPFVQSGKVRVMAVATPTRLADYPDVPTFTEMGFPIPELERGATFGLLGPANLPPEVVQVLARATEQILRSATFQAQLKTQALLAVGAGGSAALNQQIADDLRTWTPLVRQMNLAEP